MKKRLISLLLAFSMMLTFLPAGAVSAFAEDTIDSSKETLLHDGDETITKGGTYRLSGNYTKAIKITTSELVTINIADGEEVTFSPSNYPKTMLWVEKGGNLIVNNHGSYKGSTFLNFAGTTAKISGGNYEIARSQYNSEMGIVAFDFDKGEDVTIENAKIQVGDYCNGVRAYDLNTLHIVNSEIKQMGSYQQGYAAIAHYKSSNVTLDGVIIETGDCPAIFGKGKSLIINSGKYTSAMNTVVVGDETEKTVINGGEFEVKVGSSSCNVVSNSGPMEIHGGKFTAGSSGGKVLTCYGSIVIDDEKSTPEFYGKSGRLDAIQFRGSYSGNPVMQFKAGIIHISGGVQRAAIAIGTDSTYGQDRGTAIIDSNRVIIDGGTYGIRVRGHVTAVLNDITVNRVGRSVIYLEKDQKIKISDTYTGNATILCADPEDGRPLTTATTGTEYQKNLNLTSANEDYLVAYKKTESGEYRYLAKKVGVTIEGLENAAIKEGESKGFTVKVDPKGDANLGEAIIDFGDKNSEIEYKDKNGEYKPMPDDGLPIINLASNNNDYEFRITPKNAGEQTLTAAVVRDAVEVGKDSETYHVAGRVHTAVTIEGLENAVIKEGESKDFTVKVDPKDDTGKGKIDFGGKNGEVQYKDGDDWKDMPADGLEIDLDDGAKDYEFRITPKNAGEQTLTAAVVRDAVEVGKDSETYHVAGRVHTAVTIEGLENAVIKEGESKDFTVKVDPKDDTGKGKIDFGGKNGEVQYKDGDDWKDMPADGLEIDLDDGAKDYEFRITPKETGKQTLTAAVKKGENELATDEKDFVVSEMPILTLKDGVITSVTVPGKNGADPEDITEIVKKNANEDGSFHVPEGATVSVAFDKDAFADSGLKFGHWDITGLDDPNAYQDKESFAFEMPAKAVTLKAMTQDASIEDDGPGVLGTVAIIGTAAVGGAVLGYQAYSLGAEFAGKLMALPYFPSNRSALAMMLWEDAGKPMPESELLYPDVGQEERDMDLQHAARWAMENELIPDLNDEGTAPEEMKFYPDNTVSKIDVLNAWQKAQELKQNA